MTSDAPVFATKSDLELVAARLENKILESELHSQAALDGWSRWILGAIFGLYGLNIGLLAGVVYFGINLMRTAA